MKTESEKLLNPLAAANQKIVEAKAQAREHGLALTEKWKAHRNSSPVIPANTDLREEVRLQMGHVNEGHRLRSLSQNFRPDLFVSGLLDVDGNKAMLEDALSHLRAKHAEALKPKAILAKKVEGDSGRHLFQGEPAFPSSPQTPRPPVVGGLFGAPEPMNIPQELNRISDFVVSFPMVKSFEQIVGLMNAVHSAIVALNPESKPAQAVRQDKGWRVPAHM